MFNFFKYNGKLQNMVRWRLYLHFDPKMRLFAGFLSLVGKPYPSRCEWVILDCVLPLSYLERLAAQKLSANCFLEKNRRSQRWRRCGGDNKSNCLPIVNKNRLSQEKALLEDICFAYRKSQWQKSKYDEAYPHLRYQHSRCHLNEV